MIYQCPLCCWERTKSSSSSSSKASRLGSGSKTSSGGGSTTKTGRLGAKGGSAGGRRGSLSKASGGLSEATSGALLLRSRDRRWVGHVEPAELFERVGLVKVHRIDRLERQLYGARIRAFRGLSRLVVRDSIASGCLLLLSLSKASSGLTEASSRRGLLLSKTARSWTRAKAGGRRSCLAETTRSTGSSKARRRRRSLAWDGRQKSRMKRMQRTLGFERHPARQQGNIRRVCVKRRDRKRVC